LPATPKELLNKPPVGAAFFMASADSTIRDSPSAQKSPSLDVKLEMSARATPPTRKKLDYNAYRYHHYGVNPNMGRAAGPLTTSLVRGRMLAAPTHVLTAPVRVACKTAGLGTKTKTLGCFISLVFSISLAHSW
jgi:hypothetical protein